MYHKCSDLVLAVSPDVINLPFPHA